jgi:hypothetical protein
VRLRLRLQDREAQAVLSGSPSGLRKAGGLTRSRGPIIVDERAPAAPGSSRFRRLECDLGSGTGY